MRLGRLHLFPYTLLVASVVVILLFFEWHTPSLDEHNRRSGLLQDLNRLEAELDKLVLATASLQMYNYDPYVNLARDFHGVSNSLRIGTGSEPPAPAFGALLDRYEETLSAKLALVEHIKSRTALIKNGMHYLPLSIAGISEKSPALGRRLNALLNRVYHYKLFPSDLLAQQISAIVSDLEGFVPAEPELASALDNTLMHVRTNLALIGELERLRNRYDAVPTRQLLGDLFLWDNEDHSARNRDTGRVSLGLLVLTVGLLTALGFTLHWLARSRRRTEKAWSQLHDAVESLSESFVLFSHEGKLLLYNRRFIEFYPWLKGRMDGETDIARIQKWNEEAGVVPEKPPLTVANEGGTPGRQEIYIERLPDGRWYQAGDSVTSTGETVCVRTDISTAKQAEQEMRKLHRALEQSPASVVITDIQGNIEYVNPKFEELTGYRFAEVKGKNPRVLKSGDKSPEEYRELWDSIMAGKVWRGQFHNKRKDGEIFWEAASISPVRDESGKTTHFIAVKEDITARKLAEDQLRMNATVFDTTSEGILVTDADTRIITVNPAFTRITGYQAEEVLGRKPNLLSSGRHNKAYYEQMWQTLDTRGSWSGEIWNRYKDGSVFPEWLSIVSIKDNEGQVTEYVAVFSDITVRKRNEEKIQRQANFDALTGLPNRTLLSDRLDRAVSRAHRESRKMALLFIDLDRFKVVNDTLGHVVGDQLLQQVSERLLNCVREVDTVARFGGDEFVILLGDIDKAEYAAEVAKHVITVLGGELDLAGRQVFIGASTGISLYPDDAQDADTLMRNADMAMYRAKDAGRNNYQFFTRAMNNQVEQQLELESDLRQALVRNELVLQYQPIVDVSENRMVGVEALIRWRHPGRGLVMPGQFIDLAEDTGQIAAIGRWVLATACRQLAQWRRQGLDLKINVNLSSRQLSTGLQVAEIEQLVRQNDLQGRLLTLEITEGLLFDGGEPTLDWMRQVRELGVELAVDDFGTGYSSLSYLKRFPMNVIKIDRTFIRDLPGDDGDASLVQSMVAIADSLGLKVVAEGVESSEQAAFLAQQGCATMQGYLFSKPVWADDIPGLVSRLGRGDTWTDASDGVAHG